MKKELGIPIEITKPPFFKRGSLRFSSSSHPLTLSDRNYRCTLDCNGNCDKKEPQINKENLERNFARYATNFKYEPNKEVELFTKSLIKDFLHRMIDEENWDEIVLKGVEIDETVDVMKAELKFSGSLLGEDIENFQNQYSEFNTVHPEILLTCMTLGVFKFFAEPENLTQMGKELALLCKRILITDNGKIKEILLEEWGWYTLHFINRYVPNYLKNLEKKGVKIINDTHSPIISLDMREAVKHFTAGNFEDALHSYTINYFYQAFSIFKTVIDPLVKGESSLDQKTSLVKVIEQMSSPIFTTLSRTMQIADMKIRKKRAKN